MAIQLTLEQAAQFLQTAQDVLILTHKSPDGDTLGSGFGLLHALRGMGKRVWLACSDSIPPRYAYLMGGLTDAVWEDGTGIVPQTVVAVDIADTKLFGEKLCGFADKVQLCIDHHGSNTGYAQYLLLRPNAAANCELMLDLLEAMGLPLTEQIANCLYTGLVTDTGCFRFANTTARSHITAAWLMEAGGRASELNARLFESKKPQRVEAERLALNNLEYYFDGRCALIYLTREDILSSGVAPSDLEDLTSLPRAIEGVEVGLTLRQQPGGSYKISVRTTDAVDACAIAKRLGGGGHVRAAGCELMGNLDNAKAAVLAEVKKELARCEQKE